MIGRWRKLGSEAKSSNLSATGKTYTKKVLTHTQTVEQNTRIGRKTKVEINNLSATAEEMMIKASDTQPKENQKHKSERNRKSKPGLIRNGGGQKRRSIRNGRQGNNHIFRRRTKKPPATAKKTRQKNLRNGGKIK